MSNTLKQQRKDLLIKIEAKKKRIALEQRKQSELTRNLKIVEEALKQDEQPSVNVTHHALLRYLERGRGIPSIEELELELITPDVYDALLKLEEQGMRGQRKVNNYDVNMVLVFNDWDLVTVYPIK